MTYATRADAARQLSNWLEGALESFRQKYGLDDKGRGLVLAIEPGDEPIPAIEQWRREHIERRRTLVWKSSRINYKTQAGRPYCETRERPDFRESFIMPYEELLRIDPESRMDPAPTWVCFLTTDQHKNEAFDSSRRESEKTEVQIDDRLGILAFMRRRIFAEYKSMDIDLMHLQRRETLWSALIQVVYEDRVTEADALVAELGRETDEAWAKLWLARSID